jgi:hypothetical protein
MKRKLRGNANLLSQRPKRKLAISKAQPKPTSITVADQHHCPSLVVAATGGLERGDGFPLSSIGIFGTIRVPEWELV